MLKPQDVVIMLKLIVLGGSQWSYPALAHELSMSASEVHAGVKRSVAARLMDMHRRIPFKSNLLEFLIHGVKYAYPPDRGGITRGIPTSYAAQPLKELIMQPDEPPPVWPDPKGQVRGYEFSPLYSSVPHACKVDPRLMNYFHSSMPSAMEGPVKEKLP